MPTPISAIVPNPAPPGHEQDGLAERGREHRHDHEHHDDQRLQAGHPITRETITDDRTADRAESARYHPAGEAQGGEQGEILRQRAGGAEHDIGQHPAEQDWLAPVAIGERAREQRADADAGKEQADDQLAPVGIAHMKIGGNVAERRQHRIDGQRLQRLREGEHDDQFAIADGECGRLPGLGRRHGGSLAAPARSCHPRQ